MKSSAFCAIQGPPYWNGWAMSACLHMAMVGVALFLSHQLPTPQRAERDPIAVAFVTPQLTRTAPTHRPTLQKSPPAPTTKPKHVQPEPIPEPMLKESLRSKPRTQSHTRQTVSPQKIAHPSVKPVLQPVKETRSAQPTSVMQTQTTSQPTVRNAMVASQPMPQHTGTARQHTAGTVHTLPAHRKPIPGIVSTGKVTPRKSVTRTRAANAPQPVAIPVRAARQRQSVNAIPSPEEKNEEKITRAPAMEVITRQVARGKSHTTVKHVSSKPVRQPASLSSGRPVVAARTTTHYAHLKKKARPVTTSRSVSADGFSPELLAFSKLLREKIARTLEFPRLAKRLGYTGTTHVAIALSKTGIVRDVKISQPSGYEILDKAAIVTLEKVLQTTKPPQSIEIEQLVIPIAFNLKRN